MYLKNLKMERFRKFYGKVQFDFASPYTKGKNDEVNIASATTLIIGKNNAGKSTAIKALDIISRPSPKFEATDFNMRYLQEHLDDAKRLQNFEPPQLCFEVTIGLRQEEDGLVGAMASLLSLEDLNALAQDSGNSKELNGEINVVVKICYEVSEEKAFEKKLREKNPQRLEEYIKFLQDDCTFETTYRRADGDAIEDFDLSKVLNFELIEANDVSSAKSVSNAINRLLHQYRKLLFKESEIGDIEGKVDELRKHIEEITRYLANNRINKVLREKTQGEALETSLHAEITLDSLISGIFRCQFIDGDYPVPEGQYGLGYVRLLLVVIHLIQYALQRSKGSAGSKVDIVAIEEPETYMHPQMQEKFMRYINDVLEEIEKNETSEDNFKSSSQLLISTHSDHIVHSKIYDGNSFNSINYVSNCDGEAYVVCLNDETIIRKDFFDTQKDNKDPAKSLRFLRKHISLSTNSVFFADGVILVEGLAEETLLPYYLARDEALSSRYISIIGINGAHAHVYFELLNTLRIPAVAITDIDFEDEKSGVDKKNAEQIESLKGRKTGNSTISRVLEEGTTLESLEEQLPCVRKCSKDEVGIYTQDKVNGFYPTSFEEAIILTNYDTDMLNERLKKNHKTTYKKIMEAEPKGLEQNKLQSSRWQNMIDKEKFATGLLFDLLGREDDEVEVKLPNYIVMALDDLKENLGLMEDRT